MESLQHQHQPQQHHHPHLQGPVSLGYTGLDGSLNNRRASTTSAPSPASRTSLGSRNGEVIAVSAELPPPRPPQVERTTSSTSSQKRKPSRAATTYPRKRATYACITCRFRRTKCDNVRPACASCVRLGAQCRYQEADQSSFDPASLAILKRLDDLELLLQPRPTTATAQPVVVQAPAPSHESTSPSVHGSAAPDLGPKPRRPLVSIEAVLQWPPFMEYGFPASLNRPEDANSPGNSAGWVPMDVDLPPAETALRGFFDHVHIFNPVLEEEDVRNYIRRVRLDGIGWDAVSCLVLLIYAHGSVATSFIHTEPEEAPSEFRQSPAFLQAESYFLAAQKRMGMLLSRSTIIEAQCFFLAGVYLMTTLRPFEAWRMFVQALACCQVLSMDLRSEDGSDAESNPKRRIYWTCFKSELELRLELNLSQNDAWDLTYPTFFPSPPEALKTKDETAWYFYLAEIALTRLKNRILSYANQPDTSSASESNMEYAILAFEEQMDAWLQSLPRPLQLDVADSGEKQHEALRFILNGHLLDCQEVMYWQYAVDAVHGRPRTGPNADLFLRKGLKVCVDRIRQNRKGFRHRHHGTWLMLRSCTRSALMLLAAVRSPDLALYLPPGWEEGVMDVERMLALWKDESADVSQMLDIVDTIVADVPGLAMV